MKQVEVKISARAQLFLSIAAAVLLGLEIAGFFGLPRVWYYVVNLVFVPALVFVTFHLCVWNSHNGSAGRPPSEDQ